MALETANYEAFTDVSYKSFANPESGSLRGEYSELIEAMGLLDNKSERELATKAMEFKNQLPVMILSEFDAIDDNHDKVLSFSEVSGVNADNDEEPTRFAASVLLDGTNPNLKVTEEKGLTLAEIHAQATAVTPLEGDRGQNYRYENGELTAVDQLSAEVPIDLENFPQPEVESPEAPSGDKTDEYKKILESPDSTPVDQLKAVQALAAAGVTSATITDADGNSINVRFAVSPIAEGSPNSYVHMFAVDASGKETVVLRAISNGDDFVQQRDANGEVVSFVGTKWKRDHEGSVFNED